MALRRIDAETLLMPPEPPKDTVIMFGLTGYAIRVTGKGASLMELDVDGSQELASIGKDQARKFIKKSEAQDDRQRLSHRGQVRKGKAETTRCVV